MNQGTITYNDLIQVLIVSPLVSHENSLNLKLLYMKGIRRKMCMRFILFKLENKVLKIHNMFPVRFEYGGLNPSIKFQVLIFNVKWVLHVQKLRK